MKKLIAATFLLTAPLLRADVPPLINYQGRIAVGTVVYSGSGKFRFALVDAAGTTTFWSNDLTSVAGSQPTDGVTLPVANGLYSVPLGDNSLPNMKAIPLATFANTDVRLRVWFSDGVHGSQLLTPDQRIASVGYAMMAGSVPAGSITSTQLAPGAVQSSHIAPGAVGAAQLAPAAVGASMLNVPAAPAPGQVLGANALGALQWQTPAAAWLLGGNGGTTAANFLGTTDNQPLVFRVNGAQALRLEPNLTSPNLIGGWSGNAVSAGIAGATIAGGGNLGGENSVTLNFGTVSGGSRNNVSGFAGVVGGGNNNAVSGELSVISGGGGNNVSGIRSVVSGGVGNVASGSTSVVGGGNGNTASYLASVVSGGQSNTASNENSVVSGGAVNTASGNYSVVSGGIANAASGAGSVTSGGDNNSASGIGSVISGGGSNTGGGTFAIVPGGSFNDATGAYSFAAGRRGKALHEGSFVWADLTEADFASTAINQFSVRAGGGLRIISGTGALRLEPTVGSPNLIGGFAGNTVTAGIVGATIAGGGSSGFINHVTADYSTVGGGTGNTASGGGSVISGGQINTATGNTSVISGGRNNNASSLYSVVGGGNANSASGYAGVISGGQDNTVSDDFSVIGGGSANNANGYGSVISGGHANVASGIGSVISGGNDNGASGNGSVISGGSINDAFGAFAMVPGGLGNAANGTYSFAAGLRGKALHTGAFVWADSTDADFASTAADQLNVRAAGGVRIFSDATATLGVSLAANGTSWGVLSDQNAKKNFRAVDGRAVLEQLAAVPVQRWNYKAEPDDAVPHLGPMAQAFKAAFYPGRDDKSITTLEFDGVELAAIQGLNEKLKEKDAEIAEMKQRLTRLESLLLPAQAKRN